MDGYTHGLKAMVDDGPPEGSSEVCVCVYCCTPIYRTGNCHMLVRVKAMVDDGPPEDSSEACVLLYSSI